MQSALLDRKRGFFDRFAEGRMRVTSAAEIFGAPAKFDYGHGFGEQFRKREKGVSPYF
jgi:hypothetical protein